MPVPPRHLWAVAFSTTDVRILADLERPRAAGDEVAFAIPAQQLQDVMADKPGRSFASQGDGRRSAMEYASDPLAEETRKLLRQALDWLDEAHRKGKLKELAIFAEPGALGEWRKLVPAALAAITVHEEPANLVNLDPGALRTRLRAALNLPEG
jgi:protein required for attachment to host cells